jgi:7,8-dihydro-6-hydroxymethylpterin dimethyltransferase
MSEIALLTSSSIPARVASVARRLARMDETESVGFFALAAYDRVLKTTVSLCPECLAHVPAVVFTREGRVLMAKKCATHGRSEAVLENDERFYFLSNKDHSGRRFADDRVMTIPEYGGCCGSDGAGCAPSVEAGFGPYTGQMGNKTCTVLVELTNACNLACPVCYSDAKGDRKMPLADFRRYIDRLLEQKGGLDSVQLTGGEAMLHPEFWEFVAFLHRKPNVKKIYIPTNGLLLAAANAARPLVAFKDKVMVLLQFDAATPEANRALRAANPERARQRVLQELDRLGIPVQLTMTLSRGVNEEQVGWVVRQGLAHKSVKVIALQPATYSGRYDLAPDPIARLTLSDVVKAVMAQVRPRVGAKEFAPIPCSHPNCGWITLFVRRFGLVRNIMRFVDLPAVMDDVAYKTLLSTGELRKVVAKKSRLAALAGRLVRSTDVFTIAIKPFMDRFSYDQDRIANCCHHLMDTAGRPVSFCEYNALVRPRDSWARLPMLR